MTGESDAYSLCHNGHPFEPGIDVDDPDLRDYRWCNVCGEARRTSQSGDSGAQR